MKTLSIAGLFLALALPGVAAAQTTNANRPALKSMVRANLLFVADTRADEGVGFRFDYDIPIASDAGPGRLLLGPSVIAVYAQENERRQGCDVEETIQLVGVLGTLRYVFDLHPRVRPWGNLGIGVVFVSHDIDEVDPCLLSFGEDDGPGPAVALGLGVDIDVSDNVLVTVAVDGYQGEEDFASLSLGVGFRF
jgi:opacity protein-like surface antigen